MSQTLLTGVLCMYVRIILCSILFVKTLGTICHCVSRPWLVLLVFERFFFSLDVKLGGIQQMKIYTTQTVLHTIL